MRVLIIGNDGYPRNKLQGCIADANEWEKLFNRAKCKPEIKVTHDAKLSEMMLGLGWLTSDPDFGVFIYSGHGTRVKSEDEPDGFAEAMCPIDVYDPGGKFLTDRMLADALVDKQKNTLVIADCCHFGDVFRGVEEGDAPVARNMRLGRYLDVTGMEISKDDGERAIKRQQKLWATTNVGILAACTSAQVSWEVDFFGKKRGAFSASMQQVYNSKLNYASWTRIAAGYLRGKFGNIQSPQVIGNFNWLKNQVFN